MTPEASTSSTGRNYHLLEIVGAGAFGEVYLAEQDSGAGFKRKVAIKLLHADVEKIEEAGSRMRDEARILARLSHRNIVTVLDLVRLGERWAVVMDYVPGADLEEVVKAVRAEGLHVPVAVALEAGAAILRALDAAYHATDDLGRELRVVHRDIKPSNVRLTNDGEIKVLDFGVARVELESRESSTRNQGWIGTELYMAPERILCEGDTPAGDVYAAIATVYEILSGKPLGRTPVLEDRHTPMVEGKLAELAERLDNLDDALRQQLLDALREGMAAEPEQRPDAAVLADRLDALARRLDEESLTVFARRVVPGLAQKLADKRQPASGVLSEATTFPPPGNPAGGPVDGAAGSVLPIAPDRGPPPRSRWPLLLGIGLGTLVLTVGGGLVLLGGAAAALNQLQTDLSATFDDVADELEVTEPAAPRAPAPAPAAVPDPEPEPEPEPNDAPEPASAPEPAAPTPAPPRPAPAPAPVAVPNDAPRVKKALVVVNDASSVTVTCGDVSGTGTASVRMTSFPAGTCSVQAVYLGKSYRHAFPVDQVGTYTCSVANGALSCR